MDRPATPPPEQTIAHYREHGWMRVPRAFDPSAAAAMRDRVWAALGALGVRRDDPATWTVERPVHLQGMKNDPAFRAAGAPALSSAIAAALEGRPYEPPRDWGALFIAFPSAAAFDVPSRGWHLDANYLSPLWPAGGVKTHVLFGDIPPRGGGTQIVSGSHRLVHRWFKDNPPSSGARSAQMRKSLRCHPYIRDLHEDGAPAQRIARFLDRPEVVDGVPLQVVENTGDAGDVVLLHPLVLHVPAPNTSDAPRFLLSGGVTTDMWGWAPA